METNALLIIIAPCLLIAQLLGTYLLIKSLSHPDAKLDTMKYIVSKAPEVLSALASTMLTATEGMKILGVLKPTSKTTQTRTKTQGNNLSSGEDQQ